MNKFKNIVENKEITEKDDKNITKVKDYYYKVSDGCYGILDYLKEVEKTGTDLFDPKKETKIFEETQKILKKSELGKVL